MIGRNPFFARMLLGLLLVAAWATSAEVGPAPPKGAGSFLVWWQQEKLSDDLGIPSELRKELATRLEALQTSYQIAETRLRDARRKQSALLFDPAVAKQKLTDFNRTEVAANSDRLQALNFEARLLVRGRLSPEQLKRIASSHPQFFSARWFKSSRVPVLEGKVVQEDE